MDVPRLKFSHLFGKSYAVAIPGAEYLISYDKAVVAKNELSGVIYLDAENWDYSKTTVSHVTKFLGLTTKEIRGQLDKGGILLTNLSL